MAKRFYDTGLVDQEWYMNLSPKHKALYLHLLCKCDVAGVFEANYRMMSFYVNDTITEDDVFGSFGNRVVPLANSTSKGIIVDFIGFQCGGCINPKVKAHQSILRRLKELGITVDDIAKWSSHGIRIQEENQEKEEAVETAVMANSEKDKQKGIDNAKNLILFGSFWSAYPRHESRKVAFDRFKGIMAKSKNPDAVLEQMLSAIARSKRTEQWQKDGGKFIPMPTTWLNQRRWEDEGIVIGGEENERKEKEMEVAQNLMSSMKI
jgi:hypothetical protein